MTAIYMIFKSPWLLMSSKALRSTLAFLQKGTLEPRRKAKVELKDFEIMSNQGDLKII
jgi:hypothetical protein